MGGIARLLNKIRKQTATYWGNLSPDGYGGYNYAPPITLDCKWFDVNEIANDSEGKEFLSSSVAFVDQPLLENSYIALGDYTDSAYGDPNTIPDARIIGEFVEFSDFNSIDMVYVARMK